MPGICHWSDLERKEEERGRVDRPPPQWRWAIRVRRRGSGRLTAEIIWSCDARAR